ncbi:MAG: hypothetical protein IH827_10295 [Myxococcales bacterium]|nr:hypothetical protein [Myxococcales bacterium]
MNEHRPTAEIEALAVERDRETPKLSLSFSYYGRRYRGELIRVTGKGAEVRFRTVTDHPVYGRVRVRRIDRENHQPRVIGGRVQLNDLARAATAATSFHALTDAPGGYVPAFCCDRFLSGLLADAGIHVVEGSELTGDDRTWLENYFLTQVFPVMTPLALDPAHPFPFIPNEGLALALALERVSDKKPLRALLPVPSQIDRFVPLPSEEGQRYLPLEELLLLNLDQLFPGYKMKGHCTFRVLRDSDLEVEGIYSP